MRPNGLPNTVVASSNVTLCFARLAVAFGACHSNLGGSVNYVGSGLPDAHRQYDFRAMRLTSGAQRGLASRGQSRPVARYRACLAAGALHRSASAIAPAATRPAPLTARPTRVPGKAVFSSRTNTASAATHARFITPPTNKRPISAQQQPTQ